MFVIAFGIRLWHINEPFFEFHPTRQYHSAVIARAYYYNNCTAIPEWRRQLAKLNYERECVREPPLLEILSASVYRIAGDEYPCVPRLFSVLFWMFGSYFLYLLAKKMFSADSAIVCVAFYLFVPFGIIASRSFQPNPLMVMMLLCSIFTIYCYHERPSKARLILSAFFSALTMFILPMSCFFVFGAFVSLAYYRNGFRKTVLNLDSLLFMVIGLLPAAVYYCYGLFIARFLESYYQHSFVPHILLQSFFWLGWLKQIESAIGYPALICGLLGVFMLHKGSAKTLMIGLCSGYILYSLVFNYHTSTHNYYQLPLIPIASLALGFLATSIINCSIQTCEKWSLRVGLILVCSLSIFLSAYKVKAAIVEPDQNTYIKMAKEIGEAVNHSSNTLFLDSYYGGPLTYYGELAGIEWPLLGDIRVEELCGEKIPTEERFRTFSAKHFPSYFIVASNSDFEDLPDLKEFMTKHFPVLIKSNNYLIFDLRQNNVATP